MSDRVFAVAWLAATAAFAWMTAQIEVPFSYEPIGPRAFPWLVCALMAACALRLVQRPDPEPDWPRGSLLGKSTVLAAALLAYALGFEWAGFPVATAILGLVVGRLFGGGWAGSAAGGIALGAGLWFFFDKLLEVTLPLGRLWS